MNNQDTLPDKETLKSLIEHMAESVIRKNHPVRIKDICEVATIIANRVVERLGQKGYYGKEEK